MTRTFARFAIPFVASLIAGALLLPAGALAQNSDKKADDPKIAPAAKESDRPQKPADAKAVDKKPGAKKPVETKAPEKKPDDKKSANPKTDDAKSADKKPGREALAAAFADEHYPELASLLRTLKTMSPQAYEAAVRDVSRAAERLDQMKERDPERFERELDVWKTRSRVHVVSAEYRLNPGSEMEAKVRDAMKDELRAKRALLAFEREKAVHRLEQLDQELKQLDEKGEEMISRQIERLPQSPAPKSKPKPKTSPN